MKIELYYGRNSNIYRTSVSPSAEYESIIGKVRQRFTVKDEKTNASLTIVNASPSELRIMAHHLMIHAERVDAKDE